MATVNLCDYIKVQIADTPSVNLLTLNYLLLSLDDIRTVLLNSSPITKEETNGRRFFSHFIGTSNYHKDFLKSLIVSHFEQCF